MDFKETISLPQTSFPMKARLPEREPQLLKQWQEKKIYQKIKEKFKDAPLYTLHDGPPFANGHLHMGHALNKILKDVVIKYQRKLGKRVPYIPGWDCHGLPIEWMVETNYRKKGRNKDEVPVIEFRHECREFAKKWVAIQSEEFQRLGIFGEWDNPYLTMKYASEAKIIEELFSFFEQGSLYKGDKPVLWSVIEKTALAEAEVEYKEKTSPSIYVAFSMQKTFQGYENVSPVIWTTTPWTLPANRAICYAPDTNYCLIEILDGPHQGKILLVAEPLKEALIKALNVNTKNLKTINSKEFEGVICHHPWHEKGYDFDVPLLPGEHVMMDQGTGFVHTAPSHGMEDFAIGKAHGLEIPRLIADDGVFFKDVPLFAGEHIFKVNDHILEELTHSHALLSHSEITHSYPHSWRSKAPLIYRTTPQWFVSMEANALREKALKAIDEVTWVPTQGRNRIRAMVDGRPDWCLSRQRTWGVPFPIFVHKQTGKPLCDDELNKQIVDMIREKGCDVWFDPAQRKAFLTPKYNPNDYEASVDIIDVWFESGATQAFVQEEYPHEITFPADLYLEGSDQHRGWFQSSLLESVARKGHAPYKTVLTHGFILDDQGYKLSKSSGNALTLDVLLSQYGVDILRLWVISSDYVEDLKIGKGIIKHQEDMYRRLRNTLRYLLGNLPEKKVEETDYTTLPALEKWVLHRLAEIDTFIKEKIEVYNFHALFREIYTFCAVDLSAFYFDIRKDVLYCDAKHSHRYQTVIFTLDKIFHALCNWLSPVLSFTAEEAWQNRFGEDASIHLETFMPIPTAWHQPAIATQWKTMKEIRCVVTAALEKERAERKIGSSLQAHVELYVKNQDLYQLLLDKPLADLFITSNVTCHAVKELPNEAFSDNELPDMAVIVKLAQGEKCERCWKILEEVGQDDLYQTLCTRCTNVVKTYQNSECA